MQKKIICYHTEEECVVTFSYIRDKNPLLDKKIIASISNCTSSEFKKNANCNKCSLLKRF